MISKIITSVLLGITTLTLLFLTACAPQTEEARITAINKRIAPEGYITKTHLYVNWPAYTVGDQVKEMEEVQGKERYKREPEYYQKVLLEPLKLKIPIAYVLSPHVDGEMPKTKIERLSMGALLIRDYKILSVSLSMDELAKPAKPIFGKPWVKNAKNIKLAEKINHIGISRYSYNAGYMNREYWNEYTNLEKATAGRYIREEDVDGLERYVELQCFNLVGNNDETLKHYMGLLALKAADDQSPSHCFSRRESQFLMPPSEILNPEYPIIIACTGGCWAEYSLQGRKTMMHIFKENRFRWYEYVEHQKHEKAILQGDKAPYYGVKQPLLNAVDTDLPKWREKVAPILPLLQSFVRPQSEVFPSLQYPNTH